MIGRRLFTALFLVAFAPLGIVGLRGYHLARDALRREVFLQMEAVAGYKRAQVETWQGERLGDLTAALHSTLVNRTGGAAGGSSASFSAVGSEQFIAVALLLEDGGMLLNPGATAEDSAWAASLPEFLASRSGVPRREATFYGPVQYDSEIGTWMTLARLFPAGPAERYNLAAGRLAVSRSLDGLLLDSTGLGRSGQSYLVNGERVMLTGSRFRDHPAAGTHQMFSAGIDSGLAGRAGVGVYRGWQGRLVLGAWSPVTGTGWALIAEMDEREALAPLGTLQRELLLVAGLTLIALVGAAALLSGSLSRPILKLAAVSRAVSGGDLTVRATLTSRDEIGQLGQAFDGMIQSLEASQQALRRSYEELIAKEWQLLQSEKLAAIGELVASVVHEFRNPLSALKINIRLLKRRFQGADAGAEQIQIAEEQAQRLERMLDSLLEYSKPVQPHLTTLDLPTIARHSVQMIQQQKTGAGIKIALSVASTLRPVVGDEALISQALANLLRNSAEALQEKEGGTVRVEIGESLKRESVTITVTDDGPGIPEATLQRIFEPFFTTRSDGTGLGLPNVRKVVELHRGKIRVDSRLGVGTTVSIELPAGVGNA